MYQTFKQAFAHTTKVEDAFIKLQKCTMGNRSPNEYIAEFNELSKRAKWEATSRGTIEMFKLGIPVNLH